MTTTEVPDTAMADSEMMALALRLARRGLGRTWPNPAVGCVIEREGVVVGRGWTQPGGRPHAETEALDRAGPMARGATAHVTLEPCAHHGKTPPCAEALIDAGIARVVAAIEDTNPEVAGAGLAMLRDAGIEVVTGPGAAAARDLNAGFFRVIEKGRPLVMLKTALTLDGRIATETGQSQWVTGGAARRRTHLLRATHDAILVGSGTALADDPMLTCRLPGLEDRSPVRVVVDRRRRLHRKLALIESAARFPTWIFTAAGPDTGWHREMAAAGVEVLAMDRTIDGADDDRVAADRVLAALAGRGITRLLIEGGAIIATGFLRAGAVDRLAVFRAPVLFGDGGRPAVAGLGLGDIGDAPAFERIFIETVGEDTLETYRARD